MIQLPPKEYDHPYDGPVMKMSLTWDQLENACGKDSLACTFPVFLSTNQCVIAMPKIGVGGVSQRTYDILMKHEVGHCNGWPADHPDAV